MAHVVKCLHSDLEPMLGRSQRSLQFRSLRSHFWQIVFWSLLQLPWHMCEAMRENHATILCCKGPRDWMSSTCYSCDFTAKFISNFADFARSRNASNHPSLYMYCTTVEVLTGCAMQCRHHSWNMYGKRIRICNMSELSSPRFNMAVWLMLYSKSLPKFLKWIYEIFIEMSQR